MIGINRYGEAVRRHCEQQLPEQHMRIENPESFFAELGMYAALMIDGLADGLAGDDPPGEGYLDKVDRLTAARRLAEQEVMADLRPACASDDDELADAVSPLIIWRGCPSGTDAGAWMRVIHLQQ